MIWHGKKGIAFRIEKLSCGYPYSNQAGMYLNSRVWRMCGTIVARNEEEAAIRAMYQFGSSQVRVIPVTDGEDSQGALV